MDNNNSVFGKRLLELRTAKNLTQEELSRLTGIGRGSIAQYEKGHRREPSYKILNTFANFFNVSVDYLTGRTDDPKEPLNESLDKYYKRIEEEIISKGRCPKCGLLLFNHDDEYTAELHRLIDEVENEYGVYFCGYIGTKINAWAVSYINDKANGFNDRLRAAEVFFQCLFSKSIESNNWSLLHPSFDKYAAMLLNQEAFKGFWLSDDVYQALVDKYGVLPGISENQTDWHPPKHNNYLETQNEMELEKRLKPKSGTNSRQKNQPYESDDLFEDVQVRAIARAYRKVSPKNRELFKQLIESMAEEAEKDAEKDN